MMKFKRLLISLIVLAGVGVAFVFGINYYVIFSQNENIITVDELLNEQAAEYVMVLGCGVFGDEPSDMLEDRLLKAIEVAERIPGAKLILSGNNSGDEYNEVGVMKKFCIEKGIDEKEFYVTISDFQQGRA